MGMKFPNKLLFYIFLIYLTVIVLPLTASKLLLKTVQLLVDVRGLTVIGLQLLDSKLILKTVKLMVDVRNVVKG